MRATKFYRHLSSKGHFEDVFQKQKGIPLHDDCKKLQLGVPAPCKFVWCMQSCFTGGSFRDWSKVNMQRDGLDEDCLRDSSAKVCKQLLMACSMPVEVHQQSLLKKAQRIALRFDDKGPAFLCRVKVVVTSPTTQCHRLYGGLVKDCRHDIDGCSSNNLDILLIGARGCASARA